VSFVIKKFLHVEGNFDCKNAFVINLRADLLKQALGFDTSKVSYGCDMIELTR